MTSEEKQEIINEVLAALRTNSKSIDQLTPVSKMSDDDFLELNGGRKVSYVVLFANHMSKDAANEAWEDLDTKKVDKDLRGLVEVHQAPVVYLDAMGNLDGHWLNGSEGLEYRTNTKLIYDFPGGLFGAPKARAVYISKNNFKKFVWNGTDMVELKADECPLFVDYSEPVSFATLPVGGSYYVPSSHKIAVKIDASNTKTYDPLPDALYFFRDKGKVYTWNSSANKWVPVSSDINVVNNLTDGGEGDALSAEMGKWLYTNLYMIFSQLGTYAFPNGKPQIDWGGGNPPVIPPCTVSKTIGTGISSTGGDRDVAFGDPLEVSIAITNNLYIVDDDSVVVTMGGSPVAGAWNASTMKVTIAAVTGNVVINVPSMTYVQSGLAFHLDCRNRGGQSGHWIDRIGNVDFTLGSGVTEADAGVEFDGTANAKGVGNTSGLNITSLNDGGTIEAAFIAEALQAPILSNTVEGGIGLELAYASNAQGNVARNRFASASATDWSKVFAAIVDIDDAYQCISMNYDRAIVNGVKATARYNSWSAIDNTAVFAIGYRAYKENAYYLNGKIFGIRVYNRKLSESEQMQNYMIDQKRYNIS